MSGRRGRGRNSRLPKGGELTDEQVQVSEQDVKSVAKKPANEATGATGDTDVNGANVTEVNSNEATEAAEATEASEAAVPKEKSKNKNASLKKTVAPEEAPTVEIEVNIPMVGLPEDWPAAPSAIELPEVLQKYFKGKYKSPPPSTIRLQGTGDRCNSRSATPRLSMPQAVTHALASSMAQRKMPTRGVLLWHSTGSGKTCAGAGVVDAFWDTKKSIVLATSREAYLNNPTSEFVDCLWKYYPRFQQYCQSIGAKTDEDKRAAVLKLWKKRKVEYCKFSTLAHNLGLHRANKGADENLLNDAVIVIDEVHTIFQPIKNQGSEYKELRDFLENINHPNAKGLQLFLMTATPGDTPSEFVTLLNTLRGPGTPIVTVPDMNNPTSVNNFQNSIMGMVSYYDGRGDNTQFPEVYEMKPYILSMSEKQYKDYSRTYIEMVNKNSKTNYEELAKTNSLDSYYDTARKYSDMKLNFENDISLYEFSVKAQALLKNIVAYPGEKHYIYSSFGTRPTTAGAYAGQGAWAIAKLLEEKLGYERLRVEDALQLRNSKQLPAAGKKRYILMLSSELEKTTPWKGAVTESTEESSADKTEEQSVREGLGKTALIDGIFNDETNAYGDIVNIIVASQGFNAGLDLKGVRHVHIFEPLVTYTKEIQAIGRAARYCSHRHLSRSNGEWKVTVHRYISDFPLSVLANDIERYRKQYTYIEGKMQDLSNRKQELQFLNTPEAKETKTYYDSRIKLRKEQLVKLDKQIKLSESSNTGVTKTVDSMIYSDSRLRYKEMQQFLDAIKSVAVDCSLFIELHKKDPMQSYSCRGSKK